MKYIVKQCPQYCIGKCQNNGAYCKDSKNCVIKRAIDEAIQYQDNGRIDYLLQCKNLSDRGRLAKNILKIFDVEEIKEVSNAD